MPLNRNILNEREFAVGEVLHEIAGPSHREVNSFRINADRVFGRDSEIRKARERLQRFLDPVPIAPATDKVKGMIETLR